MTRDEARLSMRGVHSLRTICEMHREIYDATNGVQEPLRTRLQDLVLDAYIMGKKMDKRLRQYHKDWDAGLLEPNIDEETDRMKRTA